MRLDLLYIGKARDKHANAIAEEFLKRTGRWTSVAMREIHPERYDLFARHSSAHKVFLDPEGKTWDSARFRNSSAMALACLSRALPM